MRGGSVGTWICKAQAPFAPPPPFTDGGQAPRRPHQPPKARHPRCGAAHPHGVVGGRGVQGAGVLPQPCDLQLVPHIEALPWGARGGG